MRKRLMSVAALAAIVSPSVYAVDLVFVARPVTTYENGTSIPAGRAVRYVWMQGSTRENLRQVGVTSAATTARNGQSDAQHCVAVIPEVQDPAVATNEGYVRAEQSDIVCRDFTPTTPTEPLRPARSEVISVSPR
jgi:hypothetical protein